MYLPRKTIGEKLTKKQQWKESSLIPFCFILVVTVLSPTIYYMTYYNNHIGPNGCNILTITSSAQPITQIREYMSLYAIWKLHEKELGHHDVKPYISDNMKDSLNDMFEEVSIPILGLRCQEAQYDYKKIFDNHHDFHIGPFDNVQYTLANSSYRYKDIIDFGIEKMQKELRLRIDLLEQIEGIFRNIIRSTKAKIIVCMYFEDDGSFKNYKVPNYKYYVNAMNYYKNKFEDVAFILTTVQREWLWRNKAKIVANGNVEVNPFKIKDLTLDFALLSSCNHTIINCGILSTTSAMLSNGEVVVYNFLNKLTESLEIAKYLPNGKWLLGNETHIGSYNDLKIDKV